MKKLTTYSLIIIWLFTFFGIVFVATIIGHENGMSIFFSDPKDSMDFSFYDKKLLNRNDKKIAQEIPTEKIVVSQEAIKSSMLRQSVKLKTTTNTEAVKPIVKDKQTLKLKQKPKTNDGFEIGAVPKN